MKTGVDGGGCFPTGRHYPGIAHLLRIVTTGLVPGLEPTAAMLELPIVCIDTETTGRDHEKDRVLEVACVIRRGGEIIERRSWLLNPGQPIPQESTEVHGISDQDVQDKPSFADVASEILNTLGSAVPMAYNADFDKNFLMAELGRLGPPSADWPPAVRHEVEWLDPLVWARELHKEEKSRSLTDVCSRLGIEMERAHRAADDAEATLKVMLEFCKDTRVPQRYSAFLQEQRRLARAYDEMRRAWRTRAT